jgi:hypothetical protein
MNSIEQMDQILGPLTSSEIDDCRRYVAAMHRAGHMPDAEATQWVQRALATAAFLEMSTSTTAAD